MSALAVLVPSRFLRLLVADARNVARDPLLAFSFILAVLPAIGLSFARGMLDRVGAQAFGVGQITSYLVPIVLVLAAILIGWVGGFLFLEDRDEGSLLAIDVTPVGKAGFMIYRLAAVAVATALVTLISLGLLLKGVSLALAACVGSMVVLEAVAIALTLPSLARNKVEGLAVTKLLSIVSVAPLLALLPSPLRLIGGVIPTYWLGELLGLSPAPVPTAIALAAGLASHILILLLVVRLNARRIG